MSKNIGKIFSGGGGEISFGKILDELLNVIGKIEDNSVLDPIDINYIKTFKKRQNSVIFLGRPKAFEAKFGHPLPFKYTGDDYIIFEYDEIANEIVHANLVTCDDQVATIVRKSNDLLIIEN